MASFCAPCARVDGLSASDFAGWLPDGGLDWGLCEGCGWHLFENDGNPACEVREPAAFGSACTRCLSLAGIGAFDVVAEVSL